jgi:hypothetical protein
VGYALGKIINAMTMCDERREVELDNIPWFDYMSGNDMSDAYKTFFIDGLTQNFVAMDSRMSSTKTVVHILARMAHLLMIPGGTIDRILDGPTSDEWIDPWKNYLGVAKPGQPGVTFSQGEIGRLAYDPNTGKITGIQDKGGNLIAPVGGGAYPAGTQYILAVPVEAATTILGKTAAVTPEIFEHAPSLKSIANLKTNWMVGIIYYLAKDVEMFPGHVIYLNSPWALTSISQLQFWPKRTREKIEKDIKERIKEEVEKEVAKLGNDPAITEALKNDIINEVFKARTEDAQGVKHVQGYLSTIISDWDKPGKNWRRVARRAGDDKVIAREVIEQTRAHLTGIPEEEATRRDRKLNADERELDDAVLVGYCLDPAITFNPALLSLQTVGQFEQMKADWQGSAWVNRLVTQIQTLVDNPENIPAPVIALMRQLRLELHAAMELFSLRDANALAEQAAEAKAEAAALAEAAAKNAREAAEAAEKADAKSKPDAQKVAEEAAREFRLTATAAREKAEQAAEAAQDIPQTVKANIIKILAGVQLGDELEAQLHKIFKGLMGYDADFPPELKAPLEAWLRGSAKLWLLRELIGYEVEPDWVQVARNIGTYLNKWLAPAVTAQNAEPLFINTAGSWVLRPEASTEIENLFLASDYVKTTTNLATMEGASEAARHAVNGILDALQSKRLRCQIFPFAEPVLLAPFKAIDKQLFAHGVPHPDFLARPFFAAGAKFGLMARKLMGQ